MNFIVRDQSARVAAGIVVGGFHVAQGCDRMRGQRVKRVLDNAGDFAKANLMIHKRLNRNFIGRVQSGAGTAAVFNDMLGQFDSGKSIVVNLLKIKCF